MATTRRYAVDTKNDGYDATVRTSTPAQALARVARRAGRSSEEARARGWSVDLVDWKVPRKKAGDMKLTGEAKRKFLARMAAGRSKAKGAGRVTGGAVKRKGAKGRKGKGKRAGSTALARGPAVLPSRTGHGRGQIGKGTPAVRLARVETAVMDLAKVNRVIVDKLVNHEKRLVKVESAASQWARGRRK